MGKPERIRKHRLRFEIGEHVPLAGETYMAFRSLSNRQVAVTVHRVLKTWPHEDGATLMDADVTIRDVI